MRHFPASRTRDDDVPPVPFASAAAAWFWTCAALAARRDGARDRDALGTVPRPCEPDDVIRALDALYRAGRIDLAHARVLRRWGDRGHAPALAADPADHALWRQATQRLDAALAAKGIVAAP